MIKEQEIENCKIDSVQVYSWIERIRERSPEERKRGTCGGLKGVSHDGSLKTM